MAIQENTQSLEELEQEAQMLHETNIRLEDQQAELLRQVEGIVDQIDWNNDRMSQIAEDIKLIP